MNKNIVEHVPTYNHTSSNFINDIYFPLTLSENNSGNKIRIDDKVNEFINSLDKIVIQAEGGAGKSTLAKYITYRINKSEKLFPIYIQLGDVYSKGNLIDYLDSLGINDNDLQILSKSYNIMFVLDGLDETPNISNAISDIKLFSNKLHTSKFILTSRPNRFTESLGFKEYKIIDLSLEESFSFIEKIDNTSLGQKLIESIRISKESVNDLLKTPLSLILLYRVFKKTRSLSKSIYNLYEDLFDVLYDEHDITTKGKNREKQVGIESEDLYKVILYIAFKSADNLDISFSKKNLKGWINEAKQKLEFNFLSDNFISDLILHIPLIIQNGFNEYRWIHKLIRNYYAAYYIVSSEDKESLLKEKYHFSKINNWTEILEMYYDLDYDLFEKVILYPISKMYIYFYNNSYTNVDKNLISEEEVNTRKSLIFGRTLLLFLNKWANSRGMLKDGEFEKYKIEVENIVKNKYDIKNYAIATPELSYSGDKLESWKFYYPPSFIKIILRKKNHPLVAEPPLSKYDIPKNAWSLLYNIDIQNEKCIHIDELVNSYFEIDGKIIPLFVLVNNHSLRSGTIGGGCGYVIEECIKLVQKYEKRN